MNDIPPTLTTATCKLFPAERSSATPKGPSPLRGIAHFELLGRSSLHFDVEASPAVIDGTPLYRLTLDTLTGMLQRQPDGADGRRRYVGHLGLENEIHIDGLLLDEFGNTPMHIHLSMVFNNAIFRKAPAEPESESTQIVF